MPKKKSAINIHYALYKKIALSFFSASIIFFIIIFYFAYRKAVVKIIPNYEVIKTEFIADIKPVPIGENQLKGRLLQTQFEEEFDAQTEGEIEEVLDDVETSITIINDSSRAQPLITTTRFLTEDGVLFRLKKAVTVSANNEVKAVVYADNPKQIIKPVEAGKLSIPGLNFERQKEVYGKINNSIKTNTKKVKIITAKDIENAKEKALDDLLKKSLIEFAQRARTGEKVFSKSIDKEILQFETDKKEGVKEENFKVKIKAKFTIVLFNEDELFETAKINLVNTLQKDRKLVSAEKENLVYSVEKYNIETDTANLRVMLAGKSIIGEDNEILDKDLITGLEKTSTMEYFKAFKEIKDVEIKLTPSWWDRMPRMENAIEIKVVE